MLAAGGGRARGATGRPFGVRDGANGPNGRGDVIDFANLVRTKKA